MSAAARQRATAAPHQPATASETHHSAWRATKSER
jgi:hypothetical protein